MKVQRQTSELLPGQYSDLSVTATRHPSILPDEGLGFCATSVEVARLFTTSPRTTPVPPPEHDRKALG
jgi:hypothetical protein